MPEQDDEYEALRRAVNDCQDMLGDLSSVPATSDVAVPLPSLLQQIDALADKVRRRQAPSIATMHHFACTGGTLLSRCVAAMANVSLLSEIDPLSTYAFDLQKPYFSPTDLIRHLRYSSRVGQALVEDSYLGGVEAAVKQLKRIGVTLVIRDHTHSHYCSSTAPDERPSHLSMLRRKFDVKSVITVRNPVESFLSLQNMGAVDFQPATFEEYCRRYHRFLDDHEGVSIYRYEDFIDDPDGILQKMCEDLGIRFSPRFEARIAHIKLTGDSGRKGLKIEKRAPKPVPEALQRVLDKSDAYKSLTERLRY